LEQEDEEMSEHSSVEEPDFSSEIIFQNFMNNFRSDDLQIKFLTLLIIDKFLAKNIPYI
jgi:hypothetical protein